MKTFIVTTEVYHGSHSPDNPPFSIVLQEVEAEKLETNDNGSAIFKVNNEIVALFNHFNHVRVKDV